MGDMPTGRRGLIHEEQVHKPCRPSQLPPGYLDSKRAEEVRERLLRHRVGQIVEDFRPTGAELMRVFKSVSD